LKGGQFVARHLIHASVEGAMSQSDVHYTLCLVNHRTGQQLKLELVDLPFPARSYRVRVNGQWARKLRSGRTRLACW
jgi:hypothetical protein